MVKAHIISKTTLPDLSRVIARPRLMRRIDDAGALRMILITGQAAQGKSTLAAEIVRRPGPAAAWMHLDPSDSDPANLLHLLVHALSASQPRLNRRAWIKHPALSFGSTAGTRRIVERAGALLNAVTAHAPVRIVIDGLDALSPGAHSMRVIDRLIAGVSPPSCLILVSRAAPRLKLASLKMHRNLLTLDNLDLAFTSDETFRFFANLYGQQLAPPQLARVQDISDGWVGGLVLIREALRHVPEEQWAAYIDQALPAALQSGRLAYFSETVFAGLDEQTRMFLIRSAIFDTVHPKTTAPYFATQPQGGAESILAAMVRQNQFIQRFYDPENGWGYRYNRLFRDFLRDKFRRTLSKEEQQRLLTTAADIAWTNGNYEGAIRFFLQSGNELKAAAGIKKIAMGLCAQGRFADLTAWIGALPKSMIQDDAWLAFYKAMGQRIHGGRRNIRAFVRAFDQFQRNQDQRGQLLALAYLIEAAVFVGHPVAALKEWLEAAQALLARVSRNRYFAFAKSVLWMQLAFGQIAGTGNLEKGLSACRNALLLAGTIVDDTLTVNATIILAFGLTLSGQFDAAEKALAGIDHLATGVYPEYRILTNSIHAELALSGGDLTRAQILLDANRKDIERFSLLFLYPLHVDQTGRLQLQQGRFDAVGQTASHLEDVAILSANPFYEGLALRLHALKAYHQGHFDRARMLASRTRRQTTPPAADPADPVLDIRTLGEFTVRRNGDRIADARWAGQRQKLLLKAIIVNGCREIPKDLLMEALWPDSPPAAALRRFKITLHRLRRILEPETARHPGSSCISLKDNLVSLDMARCRVDATEFLALCNQIRQLKRDDDEAQLQLACRLAVDIYTGDFLPEEPYLSGAETKRAALKARYLGVLLDLAGLCERSGKLEAAQRHYTAVIQGDPLQELAHQRLMTLLYRQGRRSAAVKIYRDLTETLSRELDTAPDPATTRIYEKIVAPSLVS
jgi:ATP/maltotriose-dependent transcriptional regulator MalT